MRLWVCATLACCRGGRRALQRVCGHALVPRPRAAAGPRALRPSSGHLGDWWVGLKWDAHTMRLLFGRGLIGARWRCHLVPVSDDDNDRPCHMCVAALMQCRLSACRAGHRAATVPWRVRHGPAVAHPQVLSQVRCLGLPRACLLLSCTHLWVPISHMWANEPVALIAGWAVT